MCSSDLLFSYYRADRGPTWAVQVNNIYIERSRNPDLRPPRTLNQQTVVVNNITNNTIINNLTVSGDTGTTTVTNNTVGHNASCSNNTAFVGGGNTAGGQDTCN